MFLLSNITITGQIFPSKHFNFLKFPISQNMFLVSKTIIITIKLHKRGPLLQTACHPFPLLLGQPSSALLSTAQAGGLLSVEIGWATKTIIFEDVRGHKMTPFFTCKFFGQFAVLGIFFSPCLLVKII